MIGIVEAPHFAPLVHSSRFLSQGPRRWALRAARLHMSRVWSADTEMLLLLRRVPHGCPAWELVMVVREAGTWGLGEEFLRSCLAAFADPCCLCVDPCIPGVCNQLLVPSQQNELDCQRIFSK